MVGDATQLNDKVVTPTGDAPLPNVDRMPAGKDTTFVAQDSSAQHLPQVDISKIDPKAMDYAKKTFTPDEVKVLEEGGSDRFNQAMTWLQQRPDQVQNVKTFADTAGYYQTHPDEPMNPFKIPGNYDAAAIKYAKDQGFNPDQIHVLEQFGPDNFNKSMQYLQGNPDKVQSFKDLANVVGYWETHPDMPPAGAAHTPYNPDALKFAQSSGFNENQIKVLQQYGGDNFNNTMTYLSQHKDQVKNFQDLANGVGYWEVQAAKQLAAAPKK